MKIKAITLWQPWASLWAAGIKIHETRSWPTTHKGLLAVHAAKARSEVGFDLWKLLWSKHDEVMARAGLGTLFKELPFGAVVGIVNITGCWRTYHISTSRMTDSQKLDNLLGDFSPGRFAWAATNARQVVPRIPCKGRQGFFNVDIPESQLQ